MLRHCLTLALLLAVAAPAVAHADERPRRELPDYDGRPEPGPDAVDALLWIPRVITSPLYLVSEYLLRRPIGWLVSELERTDALRLLIGLFTFGGRQDLLIVPTAFFDFGLAPSAGLFAAWNRFLHEDNRVSLHAATGGEDWLTLALADTVRLPEDMGLRFRLTVVKRPDQQIRGVGWDATRAPIGRYGIERIEGGVRYGLRPWPGIELEYSVDYRSVGYVDEGWQGEPAVSAQGRTFPAYDTGYSSIAVAARVALDSRTGCASAGSSSGWDAVQSLVSSPQALPDGSCELSSGGVRVAVEVSEHFGFGGLPSSQWLRVAGELEAATDFLGRGRVLSLVGSARMVEALGGARVVPFTELVPLSALRGFQPGVAYGQTFAAVTLQYAWPIWAFLDGTLHFSTGNVFGAGLDDFHVERLRMSFGLHIAPRVSGEHFFELGVAFGSEPFVAGAEISSVRFVVGGRNAL